MSVSDILTLCLIPQLSDFTVKCYQNNHVARKNSLKNICSISEKKGAASANQFIP